MILQRPEQFYMEVRRVLFGGTLTQAQVDGVNAVLAAWDNGTDTRWVAYSLATAYHETGRMMQPVRENGGKEYGNPPAKYWIPASNGHVYYGRGLVQLTWQVNYEKMGALVGVDLVGDPDGALQPSVASRILTLGMSKGSFTGRSLGDYFWGPHSDWVDARRIVNGLDKAWLIAGYANHFYHAMEEI